MSRRVRTMAVTCLPLAWTACGGRAPSETTATTDGAGIAVVTNLPGSVERAAAWSVSASPVVEFGDEGSAEGALYRVTAVVPLEGGRVVVGTSSPPHVVVFEEDGTVIATPRPSGRRGRRSCSGWCSTRRGRSGRPCTHRRGSRRSSCVGNGCGGCFRDELDVESVRAYDV